MDRIFDADPTLLNKISGVNKPAKPPKIKPWIAQEQARIAAAKCFTVVLLLGGARYYREEHPTLAAARASRDALPPDPYGRKYMIYAVTEQGHSVFVNDKDYQ